MGALIPCANTAIIRPSAIAPTGPSNFRCLLLPRSISVCWLYTTSSTNETKNQPCIVCSALGHTKSRSFRGGTAAWEGFTLREINFKIFHIAYNAWLCSYVYGIQRYTVVRECPRSYVLDSRVCNFPAEYAWREREGGSLGTKYITRTRMYVYVSFPGVVIKLHIHITRL